MRFRTLLCIALITLVPVIAHAETITSFDAAVIVQTDNSIRVIETITYDTQGLEKHGILRTIRTVSSEGRPMDVADISVTDREGNPYSFSVSRSVKSVTLKIGDPDRTFSGISTYRISYRATNAIAHLDDRDEVYWNVTGTDWPFPIQSAHARVFLPEEIQPTTAACYVGTVGSTEPCTISALVDFSVSRTLLPGEGVTIAVGFPAGTTPPYPPQSWWQQYGAMVIALLIPIVVFFVFFVRWRKRGKDPKGTGVIITQYDVPDALTPLEVSMIMFEKMRTKDISAEIISLATKGYLTIKQVETKLLSLVTSTDYELTLLKEYTDLPGDYDRKLLTGIFGDVAVGSTVKLSTLRGTFAAVTIQIAKALRGVMLSKGYYTNLPAIGVPAAISSIVVFILIFGMFFLFTSGAIAISTLALIAGSIIFSDIIAIIFQSLMPAKSAKGVQTKEYLLGLKNYLQIAEKHRLDFHNAPEKKPEVFEKLLPYAMVFGVETAWAKEFAGIYTTPPTWYQGSYGSAFDAIVFTRALGSFSRSAAGYIAPTSSSGGSSGGGFSGGGGGGGGGGSW